MPSIKQSILLSASSEEAFGFLTNFSKMPSFIKGVKSISQQKQPSAEYTLSKWEILINDTVVKWTQQDQIDAVNKRIDFKMIEGDFGSYAGKFEVRDLPKGSLLDFHFNIDWDMSTAEELIGHILEQKANFAARWMLRSIKQNIKKIEIKDEFRNIPKRIIETNISEAISYKNTSGKRIVGFYDHPSHDYKNLPFIIIPPGYGETKRDSLSISYYLVANGFNVIRFDATNHVGESDGDEANVTMANFADDLASTINFIEDHFKVNQVGLVCSSLAKRVALKVASQDGRIKLLVSIVGVVNLQSTLEAVYREDMIGSCLNGKKWDLTDVLGLKVKGSFLENAIQDKFHDLKSTLRDVDKLNIPVVFLVAENDAWVKLSDVKVIYEKLSTNDSKSEMIILSQCNHNIYENTSAALEAMKQIVCSCSKFLKNQDLSPRELNVPSLRAIASQNKIEKERLKRSVDVSKSSEKMFWDEYLTSYFILAKSPDYQNYLLALDHFLGKYIPDEKILDAGCGNGHFGAFLAAKRLSLLKNEQLSYSYFGIDLSERALLDAERETNELIARLSQGVSQANIELSYKTVDLECRLPFKNDFFDKACLSLVLSYLFDPIACLKELKRVLRPGGKLVISSLKPHCDLSIIYTNFVSKASSEAELREARNLLSNAGIIKKKETSGAYRFFSNMELKALLIASGFGKVGTSISFGNQSSIGYGEKL